MVWYLYILLQYNSFVQVAALFCRRQKSQIMLLLVFLDVREEPLVTSTQMTPFDLYNTLFAFSPETSSFENRQMVHSIHPLW